MIRRARTLALSLLCAVPLGCAAVGFYECSEKELTQLVLVNQSNKNTAAPHVLLYDGHGTPLVCGQVTLGPKDIDELNLCRVLELADPPIAPIPPAGVVEVFGFPPSVHAWIKDCAFRQDGPVPPFPSECPRGVEKVDAMGKTQLRVTLLELIDLAARGEVTGGFGRLRKKGDTMSEDSLTTLTQICNEVLITFPPEAFVDDTFE